MADSIRLVEYFYTIAPNKPGTGADALALLRDTSVNLLAFSGFPKGRGAQMVFVPADPAAFKLAAKQAKWKVVGPKRAFLLEGDDRAGAGAALLDRLGQAKINVIAIDAVTAGGGRYGAIFWVEPKNVKKAAALLGVSAP